jgi:hypothetical protein
MLHEQHRGVAPCHGKAPCAKLMKFIKPSVTAKPMARMNNNIP